MKQDLFPDRDFIEHGKLALHSPRPPLYVRDPHDVNRRARRRAISAETVMTPGQRPTHRRSIGLMSVLSSYDMMHLE